MEGIHNQFAGFELPIDIQEVYRKGQQPFGPKNIAKLVLFLDENKIENFNEMYDHYISLKPQRQEGEGYEDYKNRSKFQQVLEKYKPYFYNYSVYKK